MNTDLQKSDHEAASKKNATSSDKAFWIWLGTAIFTSILLTMLVGSWATRHALMGGEKLSDNQARFILKVAKFPRLTKEAFFELYYMASGEPIELLIYRKHSDNKHVKRLFPATEDSGYLLFSGVDPADKTSVVKLIRLADGVVLEKWSPNWINIWSKVSEKKFEPLGSPSAARALHPLLMPNGDIVFNTGKALVRQSPCADEPVWVLDEYAHHSVEKSSDGHIWVPSVSDDGFADNAWMQDRVRDDAIAKVSSDGKLIARWSFAKILRENGFQALLLGTAGFHLQDDPIHINQIKEAMRDGKYWKKGDLLISARHLSTIFLYRPSTRKIVWYKTGPWMNQHSVDFMGGHEISVLDNHVFGGAPRQQPFVVEGEVNRVLVYSFATDMVSEPYAKLLEQEKPVTITEGRAQILHDGGLFIEETNFGRHMRFTKDRLLWSRVNDYNSNSIGIVSWSRYLTKEEVEEPLKMLAASKCLKSDNELNAMGVGQQEQRQPQKFGQ